MSANKPTGVKADFRKVKDDDPGWYAWDALPGHRLSRFTRVRVRCSCGWETRQMSDSPVGWLNEDAEMHIHWVLNRSAAALKVAQEKGWVGDDEETMGNMARAGGWSDAGAESGAAGAEADGV